ncbi:hypothetical protein HU200_005709 [Digitaria exilis]|uniref:TAZ-type domain-containing protein n=1 Tax=Digitaria exilis TaxID=1010633 RepID=A0A835KW89_9POAL|nr:hypothetical protein HU200_005709 [Digitaria exilis]
MATWTATLNRAEDQGAQSPGDCRFNQRVLPSQQQLPSRKNQPPPTKSHLAELVASAGADVSPASTPCPSRNDPPTNASRNAHAVALEIFPLVTTPRLASCLLPGDIPIRLGALPYIAVAELELPAPSPLGRSFSAPGSLGSFVTIAFVNLLPFDLGHRRCQLDRLEGHTGSGREGRGKSMALYADLDALRASAADVRIVTSDGQSIAAHSYVLVSPAALSCSLDWSTDFLRLSVVADRLGYIYFSEGLGVAGHGAAAAAGCAIRILGVPSDAVLAFLHLLYASSRVEEEVAAAHGPQLLALAHAYRVGWLKRAAEAAVAARLTPDRAVDMLKLAGLLDAPRLRAATSPPSRPPTGGASRAAARPGAGDGAPPDGGGRGLAPGAEAYGQLAEAMDSLDRIFAADDTAAEAPSSTSTTECEQGLRLLMRHFATCARRAAPGGCARCRRLLQLFRLHASVCDRPEHEHDQPCRDAGGEGGQDMAAAGEEVTRARAMAGLADRRVPEIVAMSRQASCPLLRNLRPTVRLHGRPAAPIAEALPVRRLGSHPRPSPRPGRHPPLPASASAACRGCLPPFPDVVSVAVAYPDALLSYVVRGRTSMPLNPVVDIHRRIGFPAGDFSSSAQFAAPIQKRARAVAAGSVNQPWFQCDLSLARYFLHGLPLRPFTAPRLHTHHNLHK